MDLFRPLVTLRFPPDDLRRSVAFVDRTVSSGTAAILNSCARGYSLVRGLFDVQAGDLSQAYMQDQNRFKPIINVLVVWEMGVNGLPRFAINQS